MKFVKAMYAVMALMILVNLANETIFKSEYSAILLWICLVLFIVGTLFFFNVKQQLS